MLATKSARKPSKHGSSAMHCSSFQLPSVSQGTSGFGASSDLVAP
jgi:hypothetical protein